MSRRVGALTCLVCARALAACATLPPGIATSAELAARVAVDVCVPYVSDGISFQQARRPLDGGWSQQLPELLTSGPPGPLLRRGSAELSFVPERINPASGAVEARVCIIIVQGTTATDLVAEVERVLPVRPAGQGDDPDTVPARFCLPERAGRGSSVWVLQYPPQNPRAPLDRRVGLSINQSSQGGCS